MPPSAGPATTAVCEPEVEAATALGSTFDDTILGSTVCTLGCSKARPMPTTKAMASRRFGVRWPAKLAIASTATAAASATSAMNVTQRRSNRSATWPVNGNRQIAGMNCTSPIRPSRNGLPVSAYICQPTATTWICSATDAATRT